MCSVWPERNVLVKANKTPRAIVAGCRAAWPDCDGAGELAAAPDHQHGVLFQRNPSVRDRHVPGALVLIAFARFVFVLHRRVKCHTRQVSVLRTNRGDLQRAARPFGGGILALPMISTFCPRRASVLSLADQLSLRQAIARLI